jgi:hypothetical protein
MLSIKDEFDIIFSKVHFTKSLINDLDNYHIKFINKNSDHMEFFGNKLMGTYVVKFLPKDTSDLYALFGVDSKDIENAIHRIPTIDKTRIVTSEPFNITCVYIAHRFLSEEKLTQKERIRGAFFICLILNYRFMTGIMNRFFPYPIDKDMAQALYANLSYKFLIKKLKNWEEVLEYRALSMVQEDELHHDTLRLFNDDNEVLKVIADAQGRIKDMMKNIYREFMKVHKNGERIYVNNDTTYSEEGVEVLRDRTIGVRAYEGYILDIISDTNSFIRNELVNIVVDLMDGINAVQFVKVLTWVTQQSHTEHSALIEAFVKSNIVFSFDYVSSNQSILHHTKDLGLFLSTLRGAYMSSRSKETQLLQLRADGEHIVNLALESNNKTTLAMQRTALMLYINLRTYTKAYYTH